MQFGANKHLQIFQRLQIALALRTRTILLALFINTKLHSKSCYYLYKTIESAFRWFDFWQVLFILFYLIVFILSLFLGMNAFHAIVFYNHQFSFCFVSFCIFGLCLLHRLNRIFLLVPRVKTVGLMAETSRQFKCIYCYLHGLQRAIWRIRKETVSW